MYFITGGIGFLACIIFIILIIFFSLRGKSCKAPLIALFLAVALFLGSGFLYSRTDPEIGGIAFLRYLSRDRTVPPDLVGEWREQNDSEDSFHGIYISGDTIEVYWVTDGGNATSLYWAGSFVPPEDGEEPYTWESELDADRISAAPLASGENTKTFTYSNGVLSYTASILGVTNKIEAKKQPWVPEEDDESEPSKAGAAPARLSAEGSLGEYSVEVKDAVVTNDSEGNPAIVITYSWTNNSDEPANAIAKMLDKVFQDGAQLTTASIGETDWYDAGAQTRNVQPGESIEVQRAFSLSNEKDTVEFEISELFSLSGDVVAMEFEPSELSRLDAPSSQDV